MQEHPSPGEAKHRTLAEIVALVAGSSRGVGRGIALGLGEAGARVVVSARSSEAGPCTEGRRETIEETARLVSAAGGTGYPFRCDHTRPREVDDLVAWMLRRMGRIDVAVCSVWGGWEGLARGRYPDGTGFGAPFWRRPPEPFGHTLESSLYAGLLLARAMAAPMAAMGRGVIVFVTADPRPGYLGDLHADLAASALARLAHGCAQELGPRGVTALALAPGATATERALDDGDVPADALAPVDVGRALARLLARGDVARHAGEILSAREILRQPLAGV